MDEWGVPPEVVELYRKAIEEACLIEGQAILNAALQIVPRRTDALANSGVVDSWWSENIFYVTVGFGTTPETEVYAVVQHERLDYKHPPGQSAKYLEIPALARQAGMDQRIAAYVAAKVQ